MDNVILKQSPNWVLPQNIFGITFTPLYLQLHINKSALQIGRFFLFCKLGAPWPKLDPSPLWALPSSLCLTSLSGSLSASLSLLKTYFYSRGLCTGSNTDGLYRECRYINLEIRYESRAYCQTFESQLSVVMMCVLLAGKISYKWGSQLWFIGQYANAIDVLLISVRQLKICAAHEAKNLNMQMQVGHWYHIFWPRISLRLVSSFFRIFF